MNATSTLGLKPLAASSTTSVAAVPTAKSSTTVTIEDFMKLLSAEMTNQDPTKPMDNTQTMTQLAQFTTLQQTTQLTQNQSLATAASLIGSTVSFPGLNGAAGATGVVLSVDSSQVAMGGLPQLIISGSNMEYPVTSVSQILPFTNPTPANINPKG